MVEPPRFDSPALRAARKFSQENRRQIEQATELAKSGPTRALLREAEKRQEVASRLINASAKVTGQALIAEQERRIGHQAEAIRRALGPLDTDALAQEMTKALRSSAPVEAKLVLADALSAQVAEQPRDVTRPELAGQLIDQARESLEEVGLSLDVPDGASQPAPIDSGDGPTADPGAPGVEELIAVIREEGEKNRRAIAGSASPHWSRDPRFVIALVALLLQLAAIYQGGESDPEPAAERPSIVRPVELPAPEPPTEQPRSPKTRDGDSGPD